MQPGSNIVLLVSQDALRDLSVPLMQCQLKNNRLVGTVVLITASDQNRRTEPTVSVLCALALLQYRSN